MKKFIKPLIFVDLVILVLEGIKSENISKSSDGLGTEELLFSFSFSF